MANPFQQEFLRSFQGKDADDVQDQYPPEILDSLLKEGYRIDGTGDAQSNPNYNKLYNPYYTAPGGNDRIAVRTRAVSNPAPPDPSRFEPPVNNTVNVTESTTVTNVAKTNWSDVVIDDGLNDYAEDFSAVETFGKTSYPYTKPSSDPPEEFYGDGDIYIDEQDVPLSGVSNLEGSDTGPTRGLNESSDSKIKIQNAKDASATNSGPFMEDLSKISIDPRPNELNMFGSVTYNLSLYMLNSRSYVSITNSPDNPQDALTPPNSLLLMRSGGVGLDNQNTAFFNDFFIDDLELTNVATGPSKFKQNTNATDIKFTITEPRGVTLLEKLRDAAAGVLVSSKEKYMHAPYLLRIDFKGYDESGRPMNAPSRPKYIPIRITDMQFEVTASGTEYKVQAIPFAHFAMGSVVSTIPMNIELQASTVGDIFNAGVTIEEEYESKETVRVPADRPNSEVVSTDRTVTKTRKVQAKNLGEVLTDYQKKRAKPSITQTEKTADSKKQLIPSAALLYDTYDFLISGEIANAKLNMSGLYDALNTPVPQEDKKEKNSKDKSDTNQFQAYVKGLTSGVTLDKETNLFKINAGTDITKLINLLILHSDYMDQNIMENPDPYLSSGDPVKWFKIRPVIKDSEGPGKGFDEKDGRYKYHVTFAVEKNNVYYTDFPWAKKSKPTGNGIHKVYNYIYSGNNTEVLDFDLKFRNAFLQVMTAGSGSPFANKDHRSLFTPMVKELPQSAEGNTINGTDTIKRTRAKDLFSSVMSDGVDMVELKLQIVGDPAYLPTSDAFYHDKVRQGQSYTTAFMPDGTINYNLTPPFVQVNLKTPTDYDETTGLANPNKFSNSQFSGVYRVTSVDSTFTGGVFQQRLNGVRAETQPTANGVARDNLSSANTERNAFSLDGLLGNRSSTSIGSNLFRGITNNVAKVLPPGIADVADEFISNTLPAVVNQSTPEIAQLSQQRFQGPVRNTSSPVRLVEQWADDFLDL